jgi:hypothetical protein
MTKSLQDYRSLARGHTESAIRTLAGIMTSAETADANKIAAANSLLDRGWGKAAQPIAGDEENPLKIIRRIERVIVDPTPRE